MIKKQKKATRFLHCFMDWDMKQITKDASGKMIIKGFANTSDKDRIGDVVLPSAFDKSLSEYMDNPVILFQHNWDKLIGKCVKADIIKEGETQGLYITCELSNAKDVEEVKTKIGEGSLKTFSIGYNEVDAEYDEESGVNVVKELELLEISVVTIPCNQHAKFTATVEQEKEVKDAAEDQDLTEFFKFLADNLNELKSEEQIDAQFITDISEIFFNQKEKSNDTQN